MTSSPGPEDVTNSPLAPVSWGELIDKITILEIKAVRLDSPAAAANVRKELASLQTVARTLDGNEMLQSLKAQLKMINEALWQIEDDIRDKEAQKVFDDRFIELARSVYVTNDKRAAIKRDINALLNSAIVEEKSYKAY
ncbi:MAG: DUF6165 family protein [Beijerinckiaceae bacterium]